MTGFDQVRSITPELGTDVQSKDTGEAGGGTAEPTSTVQSLGKEGNPANRPNTEISKVAGTGTAAVVKLVAVVPKRLSSISYSSLPVQPSFRSLRL